MQEHRLKFNKSGMIQNSELSQFGKAVNVYNSTSNTNGNIKNALNSNLEGNLLHGNTNIMSNTLINKTIVTTNNKDLNASKIEKQNEFTFQQNRTSINEVTDNQGQSNIKNKGISSLNQQNRISNNTSRKFEKNIEKNTHISTKNNHISTTTENVVKNNSKILIPKLENSQIPSFSK